MPDCCQDKTKNAKLIKKVSFMDMIKKALGLAAQPDETKTEDHACCQTKDQAKPDKSCCS